MDETIESHFARRDDAPQIFTPIRELVDYEGMLDQAIAMEELLTKWLLRKGKTEVLLRSCRGKTVGFALSFHNFFALLGRGGIYLEGLYVCPEYRGRGHGKAFLMQLATITVERGCGYPEWWRLNWSKPSIDFYLGIGIETMSDWTVYRIDGERLQEMADEAQLV